MTTMGAIDDDLQKQHQMIEYCMQHKSAATPAALHAHNTRRRAHTQTSVQVSAYAEADANLTMNILVVQVWARKTRQKPMWRLKQHNNKQIQARLASCRKEQPIKEDAQFAEPGWVCLFVCLFLDCGDCWMCVWNVQI